MSEITRKIKQGPVVIDEAELSLVVNFTVETVQVDTNGRILEVIDKKDEKRSIRIKNLTPDKNLVVLAEQIVQSCKYLHPSRIEEVEQLLIKLRKYALANPKSDNATENQGTGKSIDGAEERKQSARKKSSASSSSRNTADNPDDRERARDVDNDRVRDRGREIRTVQDDAELLPPASIDELDDYLDALYEVAGKSEKEREEGLKVQLRGTGMILKLCRDVLNLEQLIQNATVMGALTRVLQDEYKKSMELTYNILRIFLAFSNFVEMHSLMANYRIGEKYTMLYVY